MLHFSNGVRHTCSKVRRQCLKLISVHSSHLQSSATSDMPLARKRPDQPCVAQTKLQHERDWKSNEIKRDEAALRNKLNGFKSLCTSPPLCITLHNICICVTASNQWLKLVPSRCGFGNGEWCDRGREEWKNSLWRSKAEGGSSTHLHQLIGLTAEESHTVTG